MSTPTDHTLLHTVHAYHERLVPDELPWYNKQMLNDHFERYLFSKRFTKGKKVLDVACGSGYGSLIIAKSGAKQVIGIDNEKDAIVYAKKRYSHKHIRYITADAEKLPLENNSVDVVVSFETIEHVKNYKKYLHEIRRVLKKGGTAIISTPNKMLNTEEANPFHLKEFRLDEFTELLSSNFQQLEMYGQKPMHAQYLAATKKITEKMPKGGMRWIVDVGFKFFFRGSSVIAIERFRFGFTPAYLVGVVKK